MPLLINLRFSGVKIHCQRLDAKSLSWLHLLLSLLSVQQWRVTCPLGSPIIPLNSIFKPHISAKSFRILILLKFILKVLFYHRFKKYDELLRREMQKRLKLIKVGCEALFRKCSVWAGWLAHIFKFFLKNEVLSWLNPLLEGGPMQEGRVSRLLAGLQPY